MSIKNWHQLAEEKSRLDKQTEEIHQKCKMDKINKEFSQLSGEELFKPITKRLDEKSSATTEEEEEEEEEQEEEQEGPDYTIDEFDDINPFGDEFRPDAPSPELSLQPSPSPELSLPPPPSPTTSYLDVDDDDFPQPPSPLMKEKSARKEWGMPGPVEPEYQHESTSLQTVNQLITKYGNDPNYIVKSKKSPLQGKTIAELKKIRDGIYEKRRVTKEYLLKRLQEGKQRLKSTPLHKREIPPTPLEKAVMSRRPYLEHSDNEDDLSEQDWGETNGSGIADEAEKLINQLHLSLGSIKAGNSSIKLKNQVLSLLDSLVELGTIEKKQKKKLLLFI